MGSLTRRLGHSGGAVQAELRWPDGTTRLASIACAEDGQRMAALPCELLGHRALLRAMAVCGYPVTVG